MIGKSVVQRRLLKDRVFPEKQRKNKAHVKKKSFVRFCIALSLNLHT